MEYNGIDTTVTKSTRKPFEMKNTIEIKVYSNLGSPYIDGRRCSFETKKIRKAILEMIEVNEEFILPKKYDYVITEVNGFAKIIKAVNRKK